MGRQVQAASTTARQPQAASRASGGDAILARHTVRYLRVVQKWEKLNVLWPFRDRRSPNGLARRTRGTFLHLQERPSSGAMAKRKPFFGACERCFSIFVCVVRFFKALLKMRGAPTAPKNGRTRSGNTPRVGRARSESRHATPAF